MLKALKFLSYSNIYVALPVSLFAAETYILLGNKISLITIAFIYFSTLFLYSFHRLTAIINVSASDITTERLEWSKKHSTTVIIITLISGASSILFFLLLLDHLPFATLVPCAIIALGYSLPIWYSNKNFIRLRDINFIKIFLIGIVVSAVTTFIPTNENLNDYSILIFISRILFIVAITIPFDIRDMELDKSQLKTIATYFGIKKSKMISIYFLIGFIVTVMLGHFMISLKLSLVIALIFSALVTMYSIARINNSSSDLFYSYIIEGSMIMQFLFVYLGAKLF